jgi:ATP-dependent Clp protease adaptor protein ClpS
MLNAQKLFRRSSRNKAQQADLRASVYASRQAFLQQGQVDWHLSGTQEKISAINELIGMATDSDGNDSHDQSHDHSPDHLDVATAPPQVKKPPFYAVVLFNDDYTPMEFVIEILQVYFTLDLDRATEVMLTVHYRGKGVAGIYPRDIAETKAQQVNNYARSQGHPLLCQIEPQPE